MEKEKKVNPRITAAATPTLIKEVGVCKKLRIVFIVVGIFLTLGGGFLFFYGFAHVWAAILAIILTGGHADVSDIMNTAGYMMFGGIPIFAIGLATVIAGPIVTSVKIKHRKEELLRRGEVL